MGLNDGEIGEILEFVKKNNFINTLWIRGYNYLGKCGFPSSDEFLVDELVEIVANQSGRLFSLEDCYYFQKILYALAAFRNEFRCYEAQLMIVPRRKEKSLRNIFNFKKFSSVLDEFEKIWLEDRKRAKIYFYSKYLPALFKNPILAYSFFKTGISKFGWNSFNSRHYCTISINSVKLSDYDVERSYRQCINRSFDLGPENNIPRCYELLNLYSPDNSPCL
jgi:hypothetical protein